MNAPLYGDGFCAVNCAHCRVNRAQFARSGRRDRAAAMPVALN